jgi:hypothetical protein
MTHPEFNIRVNVAISTPTGEISEKKDFRGLLPTKILFFGYFPPSRRAQHAGMGCMPGEGEAMYSSPGWG